MTQTMSHPNEWAQFYRQISFSGQASLPAETPVQPAVPDLQQAQGTRSPAVTAVPSDATGTAQGSSSSGAGTLSPGGRVSKPKRRRSRASRRTPTTLLSTDTTNFRAMVQQFTGGPAAHFLAGVGPRPGALNINFALDPAGRAQVGPLGTFHGLHPLQHHADQQPVLGHIQDQAYASMLSLHGSTSPEIPPRPPFMQ